MTVEFSVHNDELLWRNLQYHLQQDYEAEIQSHPWVLPKLYLSSPLPCLWVDGGTRYHFAMFLKYYRKYSLTLHWWSLQVRGKKRRMDLFQRGSDPTLPLRHPSHTPIRINFATTIEVCACVWERAGINTHTHTHAQSWFSSLHNIRLDNETTDI